jgi:dihydrofolate reductase
VISNWVEFIDHDHPGARSRWCRSTDDTLCIRDGGIFVNGGVRPVQTLVGHDLVDAWHLMICPTLLGIGKRLFGEHAETRSLRVAPYPDRR